jgi:hypothetical protein
MVSQVAIHCMTYGESGRYPLYVDAKQRVNKCYTKPNHLLEKQEHILLLCIPIVLFCTALKMLIFHG